MDLERIKQNLRLRSGRFKKTRKVVPQPNSTAQSNQKNTVNGIVEQPTGLPAERTYGHPKEEPCLRNWDTGTALPQLLPINATKPPKHRPGLPHASTGSALKSPAPDSLSRYDRSRRERPSDNPTESSSHRTPSQPTMSGTDTGVASDSDTSDALDFDLHPPPPRPKSLSVETLSESLFGAGHLNVLLRHPQYLTQFTSFVAKYRPDYHSTLLRYLETQKAIKAVEYANAVAQGIVLSTNDTNNSNTQASSAATLDPAFEESSNAAFRAMVDSTLPMYITYSLVKVTTECLINEITGGQTPLMRGLVGGLSEVFCLTDPKQEDNPIIYASEEFYRHTGYGPDDVIGRNCRFLQGSKTERGSVTRLKESIAKGESICETLLNYRRDGRPFINLVMIAPLHDDQGNVKYHIGAQVDVTGLVERGSGLDGFERYLANREIEKRDRQTRSEAIKADEQTFRKPKALAKLRDLSEMFDLEESAVVRSHSRSTSASREDEKRNVGSSRKAGRRIFGGLDPSSDDDGGDSEDDQDRKWKIGQSGRTGLSGKLPGVYDSYMLIRAAPSLRIIFVSPKLRRHLGNVIQHPFLSHVAAPANTLAGLKESFGAGIPVSAKISFMTEARERRERTESRLATKLEEAAQGRVCWISATPLLGSDDHVGVWMVVVVEKTEVPTNDRRKEQVEAVGKQQSDATRSGRGRAADSSAWSSSQLEQQHCSRHQPEDVSRIEDIPIKLNRLEETPGFNATARSPLRPTNDGTIEQTTETDIGDEQQQSSAEYKTTVTDGGKALNSTIDNARSEQQIQSPATSLDEFVRPRLRPEESESSQRVHIQPDSEVELDPLSTLEIDSSLGRSVADDDYDTIRLALKSLMEDDFQKEPNDFQSFSHEEDAPIRTRHAGLSDDTPSRSRASTSGMDSSNGKSNSKHYMDYLLHPGSRPSSEYNRVISGSTYISSHYHHDDGAVQRDQDEEDDFTDLECARSPYSVD